MMEMKKEQSKSEEKIEVKMLSRTSYERVSNPLQIDLILAQIFHHLSRNSLFCARLVCRQWLKLSEPYFRQKVRESFGNVVKIEDSESLLLFLETFNQYCYRQERDQDEDEDEDGDSDQDSLEEYQDALSSLQSADEDEDRENVLHSVEKEGEARRHNSDNLSVWTRFELNFFSLNTCDQKLFFNSCSNCIKSLTIHPAMSPHLTTLFEALLRSCPQLEILELLELRSMIMNQLSRSVSRYINMEIGYNRISEFINWFEDLEKEQSKRQESEGENQSEGKIHTAFTTEFPRLHTFKILIQIEADTSEPSRDFFSACFRLMPALQDLSVSSLDMTIQNTTIPGVLLAMRNHPNLLSQLKSLRIDDLSNSNVNTLIQYHIRFGLNLKNLRVMALMNDVEEQAFGSLIESQAESLEELSLGGKYCQGGNVFSLHLSLSMPRLKKLNFMGGFMIGSHFECIQLIPWINLNYATQLPNLEELGLFYLTKYSMDFLFPETLLIKSSTISPSYSLTVDPCLTVRKINFTGGEEHLETGKLRILAALFPRVVDFSMSLNNGEILETLFTSWHLLQKLTLFFPFTLVHINSFLIGLPHTRKAKMQNEGREAEAEDYEFKEDERGPSILNFQVSLRELHIHFGKKSDFQEQLVRERFSNMENKLISDAFLVTTLQYMKHLTHLTIGRSVITKSALRTLSTVLNLEKCTVCDRFGIEIDFRTDDDDDENE